MNQYASLRPGSAVDHLKGQLLALSVNWKHGRSQAFLYQCLIVVFMCVFAAPQIGHAEDITTQLFDGRTLHGWTNLDGGPVGEGWEVVDGMIHLKTLQQRSGAIVSDREFGDMDLSFEWKIPANGNSGLKYRVRKYGDRTLGCEYQVYDDTSKREEISLRQSAGALYGLFEPAANKPLKPVGEFNLARIVVRGNDVQHWLNGKIIVAVTIGSEEWNQRVADSKFNEYEGFALNRRGKIMLTDHGSQVWYRNFKLISPPPPERSATR